MALNKTILNIQTYFKSLYLSTLINRLNRR